MATVSKWTPFGVALNITATGGSVVRKSATQYTVQINASWETHYSGAKTNYGMTASSGGGSLKPHGQRADAAACRQPRHESLRKLLHDRPGNHRL